MNKRSWMFLSLFALVAPFGLAPAAPADAAETKPVAVISIAGYDALMSDLDFLGTLSDAPQLGQMVEGFLNFFTKAQGLAGLEKDKPLGVAISLDPAGGPPSGFAFIPVLDSEKLLDALSLAIPETEDLGDGFKQLTIKNAGIPLIMTEKNGWAFISIKKDFLTDLPESPAALLGDLPKRYDLAVQINVGNVPEPLVDWAVQQIRGGAEQALRRRLPNESDEQFEQRKQVAEQMIGVAVESIREIDRVTLGAAVDSKTRSAYLDTEVTMKAGSELAKQLNEAAADAKPTRFGALSDENNPAGIYVSSPVTESDKALILDLIKTAREQAAVKIEAEFGNAPDAKELFTSAANDSLDVAKATIEAGQIDGAAGILGEGPFTALIAVHVADGMKLNGVFKKLAQAAGQNPGVPPVKLDAAEHKGVKFHTIEVPLPDELADFFGDDASLAFGFGKNTVIFGIGEEPVESASEALEGKAAKGPPSRAQVRVAPFLGMAMEKEENEREKAMMKIVEDALEDSGKDRLIISSEFIKNGQKSRFEIQEGILKAFGKLVMAQALQGGR